MASQVGKGKAEAEARPTDASALQGDILDAIFYRVPPIYFVPASQVSRAWHQSLLSNSLSSVHRSIKPWLIIHHASHAFAYDPRSHVWLRIIRPDPEPTTAILRSSNSTFLYAISASEFSFSFDPLHLTWTRVTPPKVWRVDPVVAKVGSFVVVAGGGYDFEDDPMAVETYDVKTQSWCDGCESMPAMLKSSASALWLSVAADGSRLLVTEKSSGATFTFDPMSKTWSKPFALQPADSRIYFCTTGFIGGGRLILIGLLGESENCEGVRLWEVDSELTMEKRAMAMLGDMPEEMVMNDDVERRKL